MPTFGGTTLLSYVMATLAKFPTNSWNSHVHPHLHLGQSPPLTLLLFVFFEAAIEKQLDDTPLGFA